MEVLIEDTQGAAQDSPTFAEIYARTFAPLVDYCSRLTRSRADAEDLAQEAMIRAFISYGILERKPAFWPWVTTTARRLCIDVWRSDERREQRDLRAAELGIVPGADEQFEVKDDRGRAVAALQSLGAAQQRIVALRDVEEWSYAQIAAFDGVSVESVRGSLRRARTALRSSFERLSAFVPLGGLWGWRRKPVSRFSFPSQPVPTVAEGSMPVLSALLAVAIGTLSPSGPTRLEATPRSDDKTAIVTTVGVGAVVVSSASSAAGRRPPGLWPPARAGDGAGGVDISGSVFSDVVPSPDYANDRTLFATSDYQQGCITACAMVLKSVDGGSSWFRLGAMGYAGGTVFLAPNYPRDARVFANGPAGLQASNDGGATFQTLSPVVGPVAMVPNSPGGWMSLLIGSVPVWKYTDNGGAQPMTLVPPPRSSNGQFKFGFPSSLAGTAQFLVAGTVTTAENIQRAAVFVCASYACDAGREIPGMAGIPDLAVAVDASGREAIVAWRPGAIALSMDGGKSFARVATPAAKGSMITSLIASDGRLFAAAYGNGRASALYRSDDLGSTWTTLASADLGMVTALRSPGPNMLLAVRDFEAGGGIACSRDLGVSWHSNCSA